MPNGNDARGPTLVGEHVRDALAQVGMSQGELARRLGVNASTVARLVRGEISMSVSTLVDIAGHVGYDPCQIIKGDLTADPCTGGQ